MSRLILCEPCFSNMKKIAKEEGDKMTHAKGFAKRRMNCDNCNEILTIDSNCVAVGFQSNVFGWANDFINLSLNK